MPGFKIWLSIFLLLAEENIGSSLRIRRTESWTGKWFPYEPTSPKPKIKTASKERIPMGVSNTNCDDGKTNLTTDWDGYFEDYVCSSPRSRFVPDLTADTLLELENIPKAYVAPHVCMDERITYSQSLPTFGPHRPLWPKYGEYKFLPKQRWLHSLEHGGIVALYHPCADLGQISHLKAIVKRCLRRHVISPSRDVPKERPFAVLAWGARLTMSAAYAAEIMEFIKERALKGPEKLSDDGQFSEHLIGPAVTVSDVDDSKLCPPPPGLR